jgi:hypothetical protein
LASEEIGEEGCTDDISLDVKSALAFIHQKKPSCSIVKRPLSADYCLNSYSRSSLFERDNNKCNKPHFHNQIVQNNSNDLSNNQASINIAYKESNKNSTMVEKLYKDIEGSKSAIIQHSKKKQSNLRVLTNISSNDKPRAASYRPNSSLLGKVRKFSDPDLKIISASNRPMSSPALYRLY